MLLPRDKQELKDIRKHEVFLSLKRDLAKVKLLHQSLAFSSYVHFFKFNVFSFLLLQTIQTSFVVEELVDHALSKSREAETKRATSDKSLAEAEKKYKESLFRLAKAERGYKSANVTLGGAKK